MPPSASLDKDPIRPLFFRYYTPTLASMLSVTLHQVINGIILGQYVGKDGVAAIGLYGPVFTIFIAFSLSLMIGGGILISRSIGAKDYTQAQQVFQFSTTVALLVGGIIAVSAPFITAAVTRFLAGDESTTIYQSTYDYIFWGFLWLPLFFLRMLWGNFITNDGAPKVSKNATLLSVLLNIVLDIVFIVFIPLGTAGASIATGLAILGALIYLFVYINRKKGHLSFRHFRFTLYFSQWKTLLNFGIPSFVSELSFSFGLLFINKALIPFGALAVAAFGMVNHISFLFVRLFTAAMISVLPIMSFNIGAGQPRRVLQTLRFGLVFTTILGVIITIIGFTFPGMIVSIFAGNESAAFRAIATHAMGLYFILFLAAGPNYLFGAYFQSIGMSFLSTSINLLKGLVLIIAFLLLLPANSNFGMDSIWLSRSLAEVGTLVLIIIFTFTQRDRFYSAAAILKKKKPEDNITASPEQE